MKKTRANSSSQANSRMRTQHSRWQTAREPIVFHWESDTPGGNGRVRRPHRNMNRGNPLNREHKHINFAMMIIRDFHLAVGHHFAVQTSVSSFPSLWRHFLQHCACPRKKMATDRGCDIDRVHKSPQTHHANATWDCCGSPLFLRV